MDKINERIELQTLRIRDEVKRAMSLHSSINSLHEAYGVIMEEMDEFWDNVKVNPKKISEEEQYKRRHALQAELIQIAAMCIRTTIDCDLM